MRIASLNCRGLSNNLQRKTVFKLCSKYDVCCLQETYITQSKFQEWKAGWSGELFFTVGTEHSKGQVVLIRKGYDYSGATVVLSTHRILCVRFEAEGQTFVILNIYAPVSDTEKRGFFYELSHEVENITQEYGENNLIICGDFNSVLSNDLDNIAGKDHDEQCIERFKDFLNLFELSDTWRHMNENARDFTWSRRNGDTFIARRLDYVFSSKNLKCRIAKSVHTCCPVSDHKAVCTEFKIHPLKRGRGYWKMNDSLLNCQEYVDYINTEIDSFLSDQESLDNRTLWELLKVHLKESTIKFSAKRSNQLKMQTQELEMQLESINTKISIEPTKENYEKYERIKSQLGIKQLEIIRGAQIRSRVKWIEEGEKNSSYFLGLEKARASANIISFLRKADNNSHTDDPREILNEIHKYYQSVYTSGFESSRDGEVETFMQEMPNIPTLGQDDKDLCDENISISEIDKAVKQLNTKSTPGIDGLTVSLYLRFWEKLKLPLLRSLEDSIALGELSVTQKRGIISLIHKGKDLSRQEIKNWRPITLTNTDYKIFSKLLALRIQKVIRNVIHENQTGFIKGRNIISHIRTLDDIITMSRNLNCQGLVISLDFSKAFDCIEHSTILAALRTFGFGDNLISMVRTLLTNAESCIKNAGWLSENFKLERGIKQGCCVSPLLFVLVAELLALKIRNNDKVQNIDLLATTSPPPKILQYADDMTLIIKNEQSLTHALRTIQSFENVSGLRLNASKSFGLWIGASRNRDGGPAGITWLNSKDDLKVLGIYFNSNIEASKLEKTGLKK